MEVSLDFVVDVVARRGYGELETLADLLPGAADYDRCGGGGV